MERKAEDITATEMENDPAQIADLDNAVFGNIVWVFLSKKEPREEGEKIRHIPGKGQLVQFEHFWKAACSWLALLPQTRLLC